MSTANDSPTEAVPQVKTPTISTQATQPERSDNTSRSSLNSKPSRNKPSHRSPVQYTPSPVTPLSELRAASRTDQDSLLNPDETFPATELPTRFNQPLHSNAPRSRRRPVDVLVDDHGRIGPLTYLVPDDLDLAPGDAVHLPFGQVERHGLILGPSVTPSAATRPVLSKFGQRVDPIDLDVALKVAEHHFCPFWQIASRLSPSSDRNATPLSAGPLRLTAPSLHPSDPQLTIGGPKRRLYLRGPNHDPSRLAAREALRIIQDSPGQVLILCPTVALVEKVLANFDSGALRLDAKAKSGAWPAFRDGSLPVAVGTRASALYSARTLAGIIVVEEDHPGHDEAQLPYTNASRLAAVRAGAHDCALTLISAAPSPSALAGNVKLLSLTSPLDWPKVTILDRSSLPPADRLVPPALASKIERTLNSGREVIAVCDPSPSKRICVICKTHRPCELCDLNSCERHASQTPCTRCGDMRVRVVGWDAGRVTRALKIDAYTVAELDNLPPENRLVILFDTDPLLDLPRLDPVTFFASHLSRIATSCGERGEMLVLTSNPHHEFIELLRERDQLGFAKLAWYQAKEASLPPFGHLVTIRVNRITAPNLTAWPGRVAGPSRRGDEWEILVRLPAGQLKELEEPIAKLRRGGKLRVWVR